MALETYDSTKVAELADDFESIARELRLIQGRMMSGLDLSTVEWNMNSLHIRMGEVRKYVDVAIAKYKKESGDARRRYERGSEKAKSLKESVEKRKKPPA